MDYEKAKRILDKDDAVSGIDKRVYSSVIVRLGIASSEVFCGECGTSMPDCLMQEKARRLAFAKHPPGK